MLVLLEDSLQHAVSVMIESYCHVESCVVHTALLWQQVLATIARMHAPVLHNCFDVWYWEEFCICWNRIYWPLS